MEEKKPQAKKKEKAILIDSENKIEEEIFGIHIVYGVESKKVQIDHTENMSWNDTFDLIFTALLSMRAHDQNATIIKNI